MYNTLVTQYTREKSIRSGSDTGFDGPRNSGVHTILVLLHERNASLSPIVFCLAYMAPELLASAYRDKFADGMVGAPDLYGKSVDAWAIGAVTYELLVRAKHSTLLQIIQILC